MPFVCCRGSYRRFSETWQHSGLPLRLRAYALARLHAWLLRMQMSWGKEKNKHNIRQPAAGMATRGQHIARFGTHLGQSGDSRIRVSSQNEQNSCMMYRAAEVDNFGPRVDRHRARNRVWVGQSWVVPQTARCGVPCSRRESWSVKSYQHDPPRMKEAHRADLRRCSRVELCRRDSHQPRSQMYTLNVAA